MFDNTTSVDFALWNCTIPSARTWRPSHTILLITSPDFSEEWKPTISLKDETWVDVDPQMRDATWLREHAQGLTKKECVNVPFPLEGNLAFPRVIVHPFGLFLMLIDVTVFDIENVMESERKIYFTLANLDELYVYNIKQSIQVKSLTISQCT